MSRRALFLDRDGTINIDTGYINQPEGLALLPGAAQAIRRARDAGFAIVVVTNQSGVGRGLIRPEVLPNIHERLDQLLLLEAGAAVDHYAICVHAPTENCSCRKPYPKLVFEAAERLGVDVSRSIFIGDRLTDVATGKNAGCRYTLLVRTGDGEAEEKKLHEQRAAAAPDHILVNLAAAVEWILAQPQLG